MARQNPDINCDLKEMVTKIRMNVTVSGNIIITFASAWALHHQLIAYISCFIPPSQ